MCSKSHSHLYYAAYPAIGIVLFMTLACRFIMGGDVSAPGSEASKGNAPFAEEENISGADGWQAEAPWLIVSTTDGLWAANMDGTNLIPLGQRSYLETDLTRAISSPAHQIAVLTYGQDSYHSLALNVISLPDGKIRKLTDLTTSNTEPGSDASPGESALEAMRAVVEQPSYAWSPDGKKLAFIAALDKPEADVYVYDMDSKNIQRVSDDDGQDFSPSWSPDGKYVLYFEAEAFGTGAGLSMKGIWVTAADGSGGESLETPGSGGEEILGWRDSETAVLTGWDMRYGPSRLRLYNIHTQQETILEQGPVQGAAVATGNKDEAGAILYADEDGLYLLPVGKAEPQRMGDNKIADYGSVTSIRWQEYGGIFIVKFRGGNLSTFTTFPVMDSHQMDAPFNPSTGSLDVGSYGAIWGWTDKGGENEGAWITGPGMKTVQVMSGPASTPVWNINNDFLFFIGQDLYRTTFNSQYTDAVKIASLTADVHEVGWMGFSEALDKKYGP